MISFVLSSDDGGAYVLALAAVGPTVAVLFFRKMHKKYRNFDVTHNFEKETKMDVQNLMVADDYLGDIKRTREQYVKGRNSHTHRARVAEF